MPKRRTTRKNSAKSVAAPPAAAKKEKIDQEKEEEKKMVLDDFDSNVSAALKDIKKMKNSGKLMMKKNSDACIAQIPSEIRHLTLKEFAECGGTFEKALQSVRKANRLADLKAFKCTDADFEAKLEEQENDVVADLGTVQTAMKGKRGRMRRFKTPAVTPKFDPKITITPENLREPIPGELVMSLAGTPVSFQRRTADVRQQLEEKLVGVGVNLTPNRMDRLLEDLAATIQ